MIFTSAEFVAFSLCFFPLFFLLRGRRRKAFLLLASYVFYATWSAKFALLLAASTVVDFLIARALGQAQLPRRRRLLLLMSLAMNLGVLAFFKYANFFYNSTRTLLNELDLSIDKSTLEIVLPIGISFYTFQALSYTIDVYRKRLPPILSLLDYASYVAFFPQLVAGPIERAPHLLPQLSAIEGRVRPDWSGLGLIALGVFKKAVIADHLATLVELAYRHPETKFAPALWLATYAFAVQIYCDFSGYSDIAIGLARLMGIELMENFEAPYGASGPSEFWRKWHISLSTWLRDYLYIPLGGNRGSGFAVGRNLLLTMLLGGLWHGAAWNFVLWGAYHGILLVAGRALWLARAEQALTSSGLGWPWVVIQRLVFFHLICLGWALFRAGSFADCATIWRKLLWIDGWHWAEWIDSVNRSGEGRYLAMMMSVCAGFVVLHNLWPAGTKQLIARLWRAPRPLRFAWVVALLYSGMILSPTKAPPFIYFQF